MHDDILNGKDNLLNATHRYILYGLSLLLECLPILERM